MKPGEEITCGSCGQENYQEIFDRYEALAADDVKVVLPRVKLLRCPNCGDELLPPETQQQIDAAIAEQTEQLTPRELEAIWERFHLDQTATSEVLGLGGKTFHRWLKGTQYPSRSMGYYLRVLAEFPEAFEWLKERRWRRSNRIAQLQNRQIESQFPDLACISTQTERVRWNLLSANENNPLPYNPTTLFRKPRI